MSPEDERGGALRVLIIDDHTLFRSGLSELLERRGITVVAAVGDGAEGDRLATELRPDVVLLDLRMPEIDGVTVLKKLKDAGIDVPIVMLTTSTEERDLVDSLRAGAQGYLLKDMEPDELIDSLHQIMEGRTVVAADMTGVLARVIQGDESEFPEEAPFAALTPRELEILCHLAEGLSNKMVARALGITDGTVKLHVGSILRKLHVHSRVEAAVRAVEAGVCRDVATSRSGG